jgi:dTDP-4-dehydrorhamnose 3,5-epimerase-like enzyme
VIPSYERENEKKKETTIDDELEAKKKHMSFNQVGPLRGFHRHLKSHHWLRKLVARSSQTLIVLNNIIYLVKDISTSLLIQ